jgi:hypothetical protein
MRRLLPLIAPVMVFSAVALSAPALAQPGKEGPSPVGPAGPVDTEKVKLVYVYGDDPCPEQGSDDEILICAKMPEQERYRSPKELRGDPYAPQNTSWVQRAKSLETVGLSGINSCSTSGAGGFTGCFAKLAREAKEERKTMLGSVTWKDAVAKQREKRLGNLDAESEAVEAKAKVEEANTPADEKAAAEARARLEQQDKGAGTK